MTFKALLTGKTNNQLSTELVDFDEADLMDGDVLVQVEYSTLNYKDALALTGKSRSSGDSRSFPASIWQAWCWNPAGPTSSQATASCSMAGT